MRAAGDEASADTLTQIRGYRWMGTAGGIITYKRDNGLRSNSVFRAYRYATNHLALASRTFSPLGTLTAAPRLVFPRNHQRDDAKSVRTVLPANSSATSPYGSNFKATLPPSTTGRISTKFRSRLSCARCRLALPLRGPTAGVSQLLCRAGYAVRGLKAIGSSGAMSCPQPGPWTCSVGGAGAMG